MGDIIDELVYMMAYACAKFSHLSSGHDNVHSCSKTNPRHSVTRTLPSFVPVFDDVFGLIESKVKFG